MIGRSLLLKSACERFSRRWESARRVLLMRRPTRTSVASAGSRAHDCARLGDVPRTAGDHFRAREDAMEETVCLVKPDAVRGGLTDRVLGAAEDDGFYVVRRAEKRLDARARARAFYQHLEGTNAFRRRRSSWRAARWWLRCSPRWTPCARGASAWAPRTRTSRASCTRTIRAQLGVDALRNVVHASATVKDAAREKAFLFPSSGPLPGLVPKEYLLETLVMPGLVEALGELYVAQPKDPYRWMAHWFGDERPLPARRSPRSGRRRACVRGTRWRRLRAPECHVRSILGAPMYDGTWNFRRCKDRDPVYGVGACEAWTARSLS